ncbi:MAG: hypothetical protein IT185_10485 [Acidobacteria bacterium]|nr:hypothetical protein [Acidobacteriota bacterium]
MMGSAVANLWFIVLVGVMAGWFVWAASVGSRRDGEHLRVTLRWAVIAMSLLLVWLLVPAVISATGTFARFRDQPPALMVAAGLTALGMGALAWSSLGTRLISGLGVTHLIAMQVFRLPLELLLYRLYTEGELPVQMTMVGWNFDVVTAALSIVVVVVARRQAPPAWLVWLHASVGSLLLATIVFLAVTSTPSAMRLFANEPANTIVAYLPWVWLPLFLVQLALLGHLLVWRALVTPPQTR